MKHEWDNNFILGNKIGWNKVPNATCHKSGRNKYQYNTRVVVEITSPLFLSKYPNPIYFLAIYHFYTYFALQGGGGAEWKEGFTQSVFSALLYHVPVYIMIIIIIIEMKNGRKEVPKLPDIHIYRKLLNG